MRRRFLTFALVLAAVVGAALANVASAAADDDICPPTDMEVSIDAPA